jgi:(2Fe-2S) ferredoxin
MKVGSARDTFASQPMAEKDRSEDRSCGRVGVKDADRVRPGCCLEISCFRSFSDWNSSSFPVRNLASVSSAVYVSTHVFCCVADCGDTPLLETFGEGVLWETRDTEGAGEVLDDLEDEDTKASGLGDAKGGLSPTQDSGDRSMVVFIVALSLPFLYSFSF